RRAATRCWGNRSPPPWGGGAGSGRRGGAPGDSSPAVSSTAPPRWRAPPAGGAPGRAGGPRPPRPPARAPATPRHGGRRWGGGHVVEWGIHYLDLCRYLLGEVDWVSATYTEQVLAGRPGWNNWDAYAVALRYACGAVGTLTSTYAAWPGIADAGGLDIVAEDLLLCFRGRRLSILSPDGEETVVEAADPTVAINEAFLTAIRTGDPSPLRIDYADAVRTLAVVLAANRSAEMGSPVRPAEL